MIERIQDYLRFSAAATYRTVPVPPFTLFLHRTDALPFFNYAIPNELVGPNSPGTEDALKRLQTLSRREQRLPRFEFVGEYAPELPAILESAGFVLESRLPLLLCTPESLRLPVRPAGVTITHLDADSPADQLIAHSRIAYTAFAPEGGWSEQSEVGIPEEKLAAIAEGNGLFVGSWEGEPACVATYSMPHDGITEIAGVATLAEFRGRGFAGYLTAFATAHAFARGVTLALLSAGDSAAGRVYERVGYRFGATAVAYRISEDG